MIRDILKHTGGMDKNKPEILFASLQTLLDAFPDMIFVKDMELRYVAGTKSFAAMVGKESMDQVLGRTDYEIFEDKELSKRYTADDKKLLDGGRDMIDYVEPLTDENGEARYSSTSKYILTGSDGQAIGLLGISKDITREIKAQQHYQQEIEYLFTLPEDTYAAIFLDITDWRIIGQRRQSLGRFVPLFDTMDTFLKVAQDDVCDKDSEEYAFYKGFTQEFLMDFYSQGKSRMELEYQRRLSDGNSYWMRDELKLMTDPKTGHLNLMLVLKDIDAKKQAEENLAQAAAMDQMTGVLNRNAAKQQIEEYLAGPGADGMHAAFMIDVDDFKAVNDTYGHQEGDSLLVKLANSVKCCFRESDIVARIGGDEFFVLAKNMQSQEAVKNRAEQLLQMVRDIHAASTSTMSSVSVGISMYPENGKTLEELYAEADEALYKAKGMGKNQAILASGEESLWSSNAFAARYEAYNSQVIEHSNAICYISDMETYDLLHLTKAGMELYGMTKPEEYSGKKCHKVIMGLDEPCPFCTNSKLKEDQEYRWEFYNENLSKWFDRTSSLIHLDDRPCHLEIIRDITARKEELSLLSGRLSMEDVLFRCLHTLTSEKDMDTAVNLFLEGIGGYYQANRAYIFEINEEKQTIRSIFEWCAEGVSQNLHTYGSMPLERIDVWREKFKENGAFYVAHLEDVLDLESAIYQDLKANDVQSAMVAPLVRDGEIVGILGVNDPKQNEGNLTLLRSVSEFVEAELEQRRLIRELEHMSYTDVLTGLKNRNQYNRILKEYERRTPDSLGVILVDINGMKGINDAHGQSYGDHIIKKTGRIMAETLSGMVFRTGGDEFISLCENISREDFRKEAVALRDAFDREPECSVSIGTSWQEREENTQNMLLQAEELMAAEKQSYYHAVLRKGRHTHSNAGFSEEALKEIEEERFIVYYQPQFDIQSRKIIGAEALVRKKDDDGSLIPPNKFIPFYEMEGVISHVDLYVMRKACQMMRQWIDQGRDMHLAVNFSRVTLLEPDIVDVISGICREYDVPPSAITIEVTESISKMDHDQLKQLIRTINEAGFTISLDDFGSQYSNLAILSAIDFDEIKFDKSLVKALEHNSKSRVVMENSVKMCCDLEGTSSLAEGIETQGQLDLLTDYRCDYGQGYFFSKPLPPEEFQILLEDNDSE